MTGSSWIIWQLSKREVLQRYRGTLLGMMWPFVYSLVNLALYTFVFSVVLRIRWPAFGEGADHPAMGALILFCGLVPYQFLAEAFSRGPFCILNVPNFVKKVRFPLHILPIVMMNAALFLSLINAALLVGASVLLLHSAPATLVQLPLLYVTMYVLGLGIGWLFAALGVFFRDLAQIMPMLLQILMFASPIFYPVESVPLQFAILIRANPLTYFVEAFRSAVLQGQWLDWSRWMAMAVACAVVSLLGWVVFQRTRSAFADVL